MTRQRTVLIISLISSLVFAGLAIFAINTYIVQQRQNIQEQAKKAIVSIQENQAAVLVAKQDIPKGTTVNPDMLENAIVPRQYIQPQAVTSLDRIAGMLTVAPISAGEQITLTKLAFMQQAEGAGLAEATPVGKRAITISIDQVSSVAGMINPGDYVDVIASMPLPTRDEKGKDLIQETMAPVLQNILVLAIGQDIGKPKPADAQGRAEVKREASPLVTLALAPMEASLLAFLQEQSKIRLVLRSPADSKLEPIQPMSWDTLLRYLSSKLGPTEESQAEPKKPEPEAKKDYVEVFHGLNKDLIPLSAD